MATPPVFIAGLSCRFPQSDSPTEFFANLLEKRDMLSPYANRWKNKINDLPLKFGQLKQNLAHFDHKFFGIHGKQAEVLDPQLRLLFEVSYEAFVDAGISLDELKGSNTGVYIGSCFSDAHVAWLQNRESVSGYEHTGCTTSMRANRLSFFYNLHGPSENIDTACSSSLVALDRAVADLQLNVCDVAIVGGSSIILHPNGSYAFHKLKMLSPDSACKSFDRAANGYARAEGVAIVILTKSPPLNPYAKILATGVNNGGWNPTGIVFPNAELQKILYLSTCQKAEISPLEIDYIEAHGTGTVAGDGEELSAIYDVYGKANPHLIIGSVKSNMGHCEGASGLAGLIKVLLCFDQDTLTPNLHFENPHEKLQGMQVLTEPLFSWAGKRAAISSFGFGGTNAHAILEKCQKEPRAPKGEKSIDLTLLAHRTLDGLYNLKESLRIQGSYSVLNAGKKQKLPYREILELPNEPNLINASDTENKIYLACSGNGSQWEGMGVPLYHHFFPFKNTIDQASKAVQMDLFHFLKGGAKNAWEATVALTALQLGLIELLAYFGIHKEQIGGFFGHSAGEIACSYLDQLTNLEETMHIACIRGSIADQTGEKGLMASIGLSKEKAEQLISSLHLSDQVVVACINSPHNVTISGSGTEVSKVVDNANTQGVFVRLLQTFGKAYHSPLFVPFREKLEHLLQNNLAHKRECFRSHKWHTTIPDLTSHQFDYRYHVEGVLKPVDFVRAVSQIPQNAVIVEVGPHSILKLFIKESRPDLKYVSLLKRETDALETLREGLGTLWRWGIDIDVPQTMQTRAPLTLRNQFVSWDHSTPFPVPTDTDYEANEKYEYKTIYRLSEPDGQYLRGHKVGGKILLPATLYLNILWNAFKRKYPLGIYRFSDFEVIQSIQAQEDSIFDLSVLHLDNQYELIYKDSIIARAKINLVQKSTEPIGLQSFTPEQMISKHDFYRIISKIGYEYTDAFQVVQLIHCDFENNRTTGLIDGSTINWVTLLDGMLQVTLFPPRQNLNQLHVPTRIGSLLINENFFLEEVAKSNPIRVTAEFHENKWGGALGYITAPGIEISQLETKEIQREVLQVSNQIDIKTAQSILHYGKIVIEETSHSNYIDAYNYMIGLCRDLIFEARLEDTGHYRKILENFQKWGKYTPVDETKISSLKKYKYLEWCEDIYFRKRYEFLDNPLATLTQHSLHEEIYTEDTAVTCNDKDRLTQFLSIIKNQHLSRRLNILEIGTGTGSFTSLVAPFVIEDRYIATDISITSPVVNNPKLKDLDLLYERFNLNEEESFLKLKNQNIDLILAGDALHTCKNIDQALSSLYANLNEGSFMIIYECTSPFGLPLWGMDIQTWNFEDERDYGLWLSLERWLEKFKKIGFEVISYVTDKDELSALFFIRKPLKITYHIEKAPSIEYFEEWMPRMRNCPKPVLLIAETLEQSGVVGFVNTLNKEEGADHYACVIADRTLMPEHLETIQRFGLKTNIFLDNHLGILCSQNIKIEPAAKVSYDYHLEFSRLGDFSSSHWVKNVPSTVGIPHKVKFAALNFKDVMLVSGKVKNFTNADSNQGLQIGMEFSGDTLDGKRCMGIAPYAIANFVRAPFISIPIPEHFSYEDAATIPIAYATVYYALYERARIAPQQSILIHAAAGAIGQAAIRVCLHLGCTLFVTCSQNKKIILKEMFPQLVEEHIFDSRTIEFEKQIMYHTEGRGVDIVLNSLGGDILHASARCLAPFGFFLELGRQDCLKHTGLDTYLLLKNATFCGVNLEDVITSPTLFTKILVHIEEGLKTGVVNPLTRHVFDYTQVESAFRFLSKGQNIGKVLIDMSQSDPYFSTFASRSFFEEKEEGVYLITGGLGGFGLALIRWLFEKGVKYFLVTSRNGIVTAEQQREIQILRALGCHITISTKDVGKKEEAKELIESVNGKIRAVFHLAMTLDDHLFSGMTQDHWNKVVDIKAKGAIHLDELTRTAATKYFVVFSSIVSALGNVGQANYAFGNGVMENVCKQRKELGYPALAIQWGTIDHVGFVVKNRERMKALFDKFSPVSIDEAFQFLEKLLSGSVNSHSVQYYAIPQKAKKEWKMETITSDELMNKISDILKINLVTCQESDRLETLGLDSLQAVEMQTVLLHHTQESLPLKNLGLFTVRELKLFIETKLSKNQKNKKDLVKN